METDDGGAGAPTLRWRVGITGHARMAVDHGLDDLPLNADAPAVDEPDLVESSCGRRLEVLVDDRGNIARRERVEIQRILDRDADGLVYSRGPSSTCCFQ